MMKTINRIILVVLISVVVFFSCTGKRDENRAITISVPLSVSSIPVLALDGTNLEGSQIKVSIFQDHSLTLAEFMRGNIDILATGYTQGLSAYAGNKNIVCIATFVWGVSSLLVRDKSLDSIASLAGKKVIVPFPKSPLDLQLRAILSAKNLLDKVTIEYGPPQQAIPLLLTGKTDAIAIPEPFASGLESKGSARRLFTFQKAWAEIAKGEERSPQVSLFATKAFIDKHAALFRSLLSIVRADGTSLAQNPEKASGTFAPTFHVAASVLRKGIENTLFDLPTYPISRMLCSDYLAKIGLKQPESDFYFQY